MASISSFRGEIVNSVDPSGPVSSLTTPDDQTVVVKLAFPYGPIVEMFAYYPYLNIIPVEADGRFNPRQEMRGSGPFRLMEYVPSSHWQYAKNPDWYVRGRPFLDGIRRAVITEYSAQLAQFETGALWDLYDIRQGDVLRTKASHPTLVLQKDADGIGAPQDAWWAFSQDANSVFKDARVRRAASMMIDRDLWIDSYQNLPQFRDAGLPVDPLWNSHMRAGQPNWLDPKTEALGEGAKYFKHDPAEAKKLVQAAGHNTVRSAIAWHNNGSDKRREEITQGMISDGNVFDLRIDVIDYNVEYRNRQRAKGHGFEGMQFFMNAGLNEESWFANMYTPGGKRAMASEPIPKITDMVTRVRAESDPQRYNQLMKDIQKELALDMSNIIFPGFAVGFNLHWPWLRNYGVFTSGDATANNSSSRSYTQYWYDKSLHT
jgi:ABC-type transport system substrate-binding protein